MYNTLIMIVTIVIMAAGYSYAQDPVPDPLWLEVSVINGSVKQFTIQGDQYYDEASTFTWTVYGGRMFFDEALTQLAGDGSTVEVLGDGNNNTQMWVVWDVFTKPLEYGYIYVKERSSKNCEKAIDDVTKYKGLNVEVIAPPDIRFLEPETMTCSNLEGINIEVEIKGFAPFDLTYVLDGDTITTRVEEGEMVDSDFDGKANNLIFTVDDFIGTDVPMVHEFELIKAVSEGVPGKVLEHPTHSVFAYVQPEASIISHSWTEVTTGESHVMTLDNPDPEGAEWYWELYSVDGTLYFEESNIGRNFANIPFEYPPGDYELISYYRHSNGCYSLSDTLEIEIFPLPTLAFSEQSKDIVGCSALSYQPDETFEFVLDYVGALSFDFSYEVYDYNNLLLWGDTIKYVTDRHPSIVIPHTFINEELPEINRDWRVILTRAINGEGVNVDIFDNTIWGGRDERKITIHPKPIINDDINFAN